MIVFKDAEKHEPKKEGLYLCITKYDGESYLDYTQLYWKHKRWVKTDDFKILAFSETPPKTALKGIKPKLRNRFTRYYSGKDGEHIIVDENKNKICSVIDINHANIIVQALNIQ